MLKKLRLKFVCIMMALVTVMLCAIFGLVIHFTNENLEQKSLTALQQAASNPGFSREPFASGDMLPYFIISRDLFGNLRVTGTVYFESYGEETLRQIYDTASRASTKSGQLPGYDLMYLKEGSRIVFLDISSQRLTMASLTQVCIAVGVVSFFLLLFASILLAKWAVKPVEKAWKQQRQFVSDASHELKTPLTVILTNAELLQQTQEASAQKQYADSILTMSRQMRTLVEGLLELARVDNGAAKANAGPVAFSMLVEEGVLPFEPLMFEKDLTLHTEVEQGISITATESYLRQVLDILLDNAMKYAEPNGKVFVVLKKKGSNALLSVANRGSIPSEELKSIFDRFYRGDSSRGRDGSFGLGLSIAQSIVTELGGKIWAENDEGWVVFRVQLPLRV